MNVAIIPARGGSKRIPGKNIKVFAGKPIIAYSIEAAQQAQLFDRIVVSTDSEDIATVARRYGAEAPFQRPPALADDFASTSAVLLHALNWFFSQGVDVAYMCCIYATAPFVQVEYLLQGWEIIKRSNAGCVLPVTTYPASIYRSLRVGENGRLGMVWPEYELTRSNDLEEMYHDAGQFYWLDCQQFRNEKRIYMDNARPVMLPRYLVQDINTLEDWRAAEILYEFLMLSGRIGK